jgi:pSer/pThr/pTyr-binding forkhead associated (FHA) protein
VLDCSRCGSALDLTARDCRRCGADARPSIPAGVGLVCRACGTFHEPGSAWCTACAQRLSDAAPDAAGTPARVIVPPVANGSIPAAEPRLRVVVVRPDGSTAAARAIGPEPLVCGRTAPLALDEPSAAGEHLRFTPNGDTAVAEDLGSRSGTFVRLRGATALSAPAEIRVGRQRLRLELHKASDGGSGPGLLVQLWPDGRAKAVFPLRSGVNLLGRDIGDVSFPTDRSVSARHARLTVGVEPQPTLEDLGSSNGTFVRLAGVETVRAGDQLLVGNQLLRVEAIT